MGQRASYDDPNYTPRMQQAPEVGAILRTDTSRRFHDLMDAAMLVSHYKYGLVADAYPEKVNAVESLKKRLQMYAKTGNVEYLVDVANFAMIEFMHPAHAKAHYTPTDASGSPGRALQNKDIYDKPEQYRNSDIEPAA